MAGAAGVLGEFLKGYFSSNRQAQAAGQEKARGLQEMALKNLNMAEDTRDPAVASLLRKQADDFTRQSEKVLSQKYGAYHLFAKLFKGAGQDNPLEGATQLGLGGAAPYGYEDKTIQHPGTPPEQGQPQGQSQEQPAGIASMISGTQAMPAPKPVEGPAGPMPQAAPTPEQAPVVDTIPGVMMPPPRTITSQVPIPRRTEVGYKHPDEATGIGAERIQLGPGLYQPTINKLPVSENEYGKWVLRMGERDVERKYASEDREAALESRKSMVEWEANYKAFRDAETLRKFALTPVGVEMQKNNPEGFRDLSVQMTTGIVPKDRPPKIMSFSVQLPSGHRVKRTFDYNTKEKIMDDEPQVPSAWDQKVINYITLHRNASIGDAEKAIAAESLRDERVANALKDMQLEKSTESIEAMRQLKALRQQKLDMSNVAGVQKILAVCMHAADVAVASSQGMMGNDQYMALVISNLQNYGGMDWNQAREALNTAGLSDFYEDQAKNYSNAIRRVPSGGGKGPAGILQPETTGGGTSAEAEAVIPGKTPGAYTPRR